MDLSILSSYRELEVPRKRTRIAESQSPYPDISLRVYHPDGAFQNIAVLGALLQAQGEKYWISDKEIKYLAGLCFRYCYNGKWRTLQDLLEGALNYEEFVALAIRQLGTHTFYGNLTPLIRTYSRTIQELDNNQKGRVRRPKRKRGYDDKGSLRPYHQRGRNLPGLELEREDRRTLVKHPLLKGETFSEGGRILEITSQEPRNRKEGIKNVST